MVKNANIHKLGSLLDFFCERNIRLRRLLISTWMVMNQNHASRSNKKGFFQNHANIYHGPGNSTFTNLILFHQTITPIKKQRIKLFMRQTCKLAFTVIKNACGTFHHQNILHFCGLNSSAQLNSTQKALPPSLAYANMS